MPRLNSNDLTFYILTGSGMALGLAIVLGTIVMTRRQTHERDAGYRAYCAARGYLYTGDRPGEEQAYADVIAFFSAGVYRYWRYEISGAIKGIPFVAFEYTYLDQPRHARTFVHAIMKWELPEKGLPELYLLPANVFYETATSYSAPRIEFPDDPFFTETYAVLAPEPDAARTYMTHEIRSGLRTWLEADPEQYLVSYEKLLFWYQVGYLPAPDQLDAFIAAGEKLHRVLNPD